MLPQVMLMLLSAQTVPIQRARVPYSFDELNEANAGTRVARKSPLERRTLYTHQVLHDAEPLTVGSRLDHGWITAVIQLFCCRKKGGWLDHGAVIQLVCCSKKGGWLDHGWITRRDPWLCLVHEEHHAAEERCAQGAHEKLEQGCAFARVEEEREGARVGQRYGGPIDRLKARVLQDAAVWRRLFCELADGVGCSESGVVGAPRHHQVRRARLSC